MQTGPAMREAAPGPAGQLPGQDASGPMPSRTLKNCRWPRPTPTHALFYLKSPLLERKAGRAYSCWHLAPWVHTLSAALQEKRFLKLMCKSNLVSSDVMISCQGTDPGPTLPTPSSMTRTGLSAIQYVQYNIS